MQLEVDDTTNTLQDISTDVNNTTWNTPRAIQDVTGLDKSAHERIFLLADFTITLNGAGFDAASNKAHQVLKTISDSTVTRAIHLELPTGTDLFSTDPVCVFEEYQMNRGADGGITWSARGSLSNGIPASYA